MNTTFTFDKAGNLVQIPRLSTSSYRIDGSSESTQSVVLNIKDETLIRIAAIEANSDGLYFLIAEDPTATNTSFYLPSGAWEYHIVPAGYKIAVFDGVANVGIVG